jgi:hypothetical protein
MYVRVCVCVRVCVPAAEAVCARGGAGRAYRLRRDHGPPLGEWVPVALTVQPLTAATEPLLQQRGPLPHGLNYIALGD